MSGKSAKTLRIIGLIISTSGLIVLLRISTVFTLIPMRFSITKCKEMRTISSNVVP